jgi:ATP-dependent exoDNAse (exonuclease V) alpha subunit
MNREQMLASIERAKALVEAAKVAKAEKLQAEEATRIAALGLKQAVAMPSSVKTNSSMTWNPEQQMAIDYGFYGRSFNLIGAAGTGKTTTLKAILQGMIEGHKIPPLHVATKHLAAGAPGVALISYTRRAVRNIAKQMPEYLKPHCITFHKLVEYEPEYYTEWDAEKEIEVNKMRFAPGRNRFNPLPGSLKLIVVDEASMLSIDYFNELLAALPDPSQVQFIFLGDLNQLPPVYGQAILGKMLLQLPIIELTRVYRQALESPIISLALAVKDNNFSSLQADIRDKVFTIEGGPIDLLNVSNKTTLYREGRGKVTLHPWKKVLDKEDALMVMQSQLGRWMASGDYDPEQDLVLCPWNKSFGTDELNLAIANHISKTQGKMVHEVIAGFNKFYFAVGDKLLVDKQEAIILEITRNPRYLGKHPQPASTTMNRWGAGGTGDGGFGDDITDDDIDLMLAHAAEVEDRTTEASHCIKVLFLDTDEEETLTKSAELNGASFAYATTVHKAQGSECRRVFIITHDCHAAMCSRELIYTAITRAAEELYIVMPPKLLAKSAAKPRIKGDTLAAKLEFFNSRLQEKAE